jgi:pimeloyl-ACP methyl ester carboxylesterase
MAERTLVLVHSPLVGPSTWRPAAEQLRARGRHAVVPSLAHTVASPPPRYDALAGAVSSALDDCPSETIALVVHSGAGALVPSIVDTAPRLVDAVVFVDATLPYPGRAWVDTVPAERRDELRRLAGPDGLLPPWQEWFPAEVIRDLMPDPQVRAALCAEIPRVPSSYLEEVAPALDAWRERPCGYLQLSAGYDGAAAEARRRGWPVVRHDGHHLSAVTDPAAVASAVLAVLDRL